MRLKYELIFTDIGGKTIAVPVDSGEKDNILLQCNESASAILKLLKDDMTEDQLVLALSKVYSDNESQIRTFVRKFIQLLQDKQLLEL